jgi:cysteine-rich repeat protein
MRLFDPDGTARGAAVRVSEYVAGPNQMAVTHLAVDGAGRLVAVGVRTNLVNGTDVYARRFDATGVPLGDASLVHGSDPGEHVEPDVACDGGGNCLVAWSEGFESSAPDTPVSVRAYDASGSAVGPTQLVANGPAIGVRVERGTRSRFVTTWHDGERATGAIVSICPTGIATCGDGAVVSVCEECDAGAANSDVVADACRTDCRAAFCGDGVVDSDEGCDDGNATSCDGCSDRCQPEIGTGCGDGLREPSCEVCDDGNVVAGDGCSSSCTVERIPGGGSSRTDCLAEWIVVNSANVPLYDVHHVINRKQVCVDDDPRCDLDGGTPGSCTFSVQVCANDTDVLGCTRPERLQSWTLVAPSAALAATRPALAAVRDAFLPVPAEIVGPSASDVCSDALAVPVPLRGSPGAFATGKLRLKARATDYGNATDADTLQLMCRPAS